MWLACTDHTACGDRLQAQTSAPLHACDPEVGGGAVSASVSACLDVVLCVAEGGSLHCKAYHSGFKLAVKRGSSVSHGGLSTCYGGMLLTLQTQAHTHSCAHKDAGVVYGCGTKVGGSPQSLVVVQ